MLLRGERQPDAAKTELFETMGVYSGRCVIDGNLLTTKVDLAWEPSWEGSLRPRFVELQGDRLSLSTGEQRDVPKYPSRPTKGYVIWEREV
jgi:hypothetical protein